MKLKNKPFLYAATAVIGLGLINGGNNFETKGCEKYQEKITSDGDIHLVFDEKPYAERGLNEKPNYSLLDYSGRSDELKKEHRYKLMGRDPWLGQDRLLDFKECKKL